MANIDLDAFNRIMGQNWKFPKKEEIAKVSYSEAADVLRNGGKLSRAFPNYQERRAQIEMSQEVEKALEQERSLALEASTGTGKTLGYSIPAVLTDKKVIISTSGKALQDQLFDKDIPLLQRWVKPFEAVVMKGKGSYLCIDRMHRYGMEPARSNELDALYRRVVAATNDPAFEGDFDKIGFHVKDELKSGINVDDDECTKGKCRFYQECYFYKNKKKADTAQVVVVNHYLLLNDARSGERVLPERDAIIIDEAHNLESDATGVFTLELKKSQIDLLLKLKRLKVVPQDTIYPAQKQCERVWQLLEGLFPKDASMNTIALEEPIEEGLHLASCLDEVGRELQKRKPGSLSEHENELFDKLVQRAKNLAENVRKVFSRESTNHVYYLKKEIKGDKEQVTVLMVPIDVSSFLKTNLFDKNTVICVSATLAAGEKKVVEGDETFIEPNFDYFCQRVGLTDERTKTRVLPLVFNYKRNALLYIPDDLPRYTFGKGKEAQAYKHAIGERIYQLVDISQGRAFLLFSSKDMMNTVYDQIAYRLSYPIFRQGDLPTPEITSQFKKAGNGVLFGLKTFWEGVDIAGDALSLVVIDKLPNVPPNDPVHSARRKRIEESGGSGYVLYDQPQVITKLKQGVGRLIRTDTDRGVMAILDVRTNSSIRKAMPPAIQTKSLEDVSRFFA